MKKGLLVLSFIVAFSGLIVNNANAQMKTIAFRLLPGQDLRMGIDSVVKKNNIQAGWILSGVGSLTKFNMRFANMQNNTTETGHFEIVSLTGTVSANGGHLHISVSDGTGKTIGGHLLKENIIYTTAEIVIGYDEKMKFTRVKDGTTPFEELKVD
jgi:uncharacterized protein